MGWIDRVEKIWIIIVTDSRIISFFHAGSAGFQKF